MTSSSSSSSRGRSAGSEARESVAAAPAVADGVDRDSDLRYALEVVQAPTRGRTCGFGDADRRALSAPLIARLRVHSRETGEEISTDDIDISFLVVAADLWSADGKEEMNLVQHPSSQYSKSASPSLIESYKPSSFDDRHWLPHSMYHASTSRPGSSGTITDGMPMNPIDFASAGQQSQHRRYTPLPYDHSQSRDTLRPPSSSSVPSLLPEGPTRFTATFGSPPLNTFAFQAPRLSPPNHHTALAEESELERYPSASTSYYRDHPSTSASNVSSFGQRPTTMSTRRPSTGATSLFAGVHVSCEEPATRRSEGEFTCVKNLIGALTTNGHKLKAPAESNYGIFFVFHDLSVRTEGTFTIRLRLVSIGRHLHGLHTGTSPVLSECYTPPFEVMSAKKFPGMLDPTPMSQAFAKQGLRIPTRKGANRKRRRQEGPDGRESDPPVEDDEDGSYS